MVDGVRMRLNNSFGKCGIPTERCRRGRKEKEEDQKCEKKDGRTKKKTRRKQEYVCKWRVE